MRRLFLVLFLHLVLFAQAWIAFPAHAGDHDNNSRILYHWDKEATPPAAEYILEWHNGDATPDTLTAPAIDQRQLDTYLAAVTVGLLDESMRGAASPLSVWWIGLPNESARTDFQNAFWDYAKAQHHPCR